MPEPQGKHTSTRRVDTMNKSIKTNPEEFITFLQYIPKEIAEKVWLIPLRAGTKEPEIQKGESAKDEKYRLKPEQALERLKKGLNVGMYAILDGLLFADIDAKSGRIVLPQDKRATLPITLTIKTRNGGLQYYYINNGKFKNKIHFFNGTKAGEIRADWYYVVAPGSYVEPDEDAVDDADGVYRVIRTAPIVVLEAIPSGITIKDSPPKKEIDANGSLEYKNDMGMTLSEIRKKDPKLDNLLSGAHELNYLSRSEADMATAQKLYWWRFNNSDIEGILRDYRPYEKTQRDDYLKTTIGNIQRGEQYNRGGTKYNDMEYVPEPLKEHIETNQERRMNILLPDDHFISQYVKWGASLTDAYSEYFVFCGLWILSHITRGRIILKIKQEYVRGNIWGMLMGNSTSSRKSTAVNKTRKMVEIATEMTLPNQDFSLEGYLESLALNPTMSNVRDEASGLLAKYHQKYNDGIFDLECSIYDCQNAEKRLASGKAKEPKTYRVINPYVTKLYATTPDKLASCMSLLDFTCGYGYRFLFCFPKYRHERKPLELETEEDMKAWAEILTKIKKLDDFFKRQCGDIEFGATPEAIKYHDQICMELESKAEPQNNDILNSIIGRSQIHIIKIAMLIELGKPEMSTTVTKESVEIASDMVVNFFIPSILEIIERIQEDIKNNKIEKIKSILRRLGGTATHTKALRDSNLTSKEFNECIQTMLESHTIRISDKKPTEYQLISHNTPLEIRDIRKVREVRKYNDSDNTSTNFTKSHTHDVHHSFLPANVLTNSTNSTNETNSHQQNPVTKNRHANKTIYQVIEESAYEWGRVRGKTGSSITLAEALQWVFEHTGLSTEAVRPYLKRIFKITPHQSNQCKTDSHKECVGYECDCDCHLNQYMKVVMLKAIPLFVGGDGLNYGEFKEGDTTVLPETNAKALISRGVACALHSADCKNDNVG